MAQRSGFFQDSGGDRTYSADDFARRFRDFMTYGVFIDDATSLADELEVTANDSDLVVEINLGSALIYGYFFEVYAGVEELTLTAGDSVNPRIDRIVARMDISSPVRSIVLAVLEGTPGAIPVAPALTQTSSFYEISLAQILVPQSATLILDSNVTDEREAVAIKALAPVTSTGREVDGSASISLSAFDCGGTIINNYGQAASDVALSLPTAEAGLNFIAVCGTNQLANTWKFTADTNDKIYLDGVPGSDNESVIVTPTVGSCIAFYTFQTGSTSWDWFASATFGSFTAGV